MIRLAAFALALAACGPGSYADLERPSIAVVTTEPGGFCTSVRAIDGAGAVWASSGCGEGSDSLSRRSTTIGAADRAALDASFDEVLALADDAECDLPSATGRRYRFVRTIPGGGEDDVRLCEPGVPLVAAQLADRFESLGVPPLDAGAPSDAGP